MTRRPALLAVPLLLALAACGSSNGDSPTVAQGAASATAAPAASAPGSSAPAAGAPTTSAACPTTARTVAPPAGVSKDLKTKPTVPAQKTAAPAGVTVADVVTGTGAQAQAGRQVQVKYVGSIWSSGKEFDSSWKVSPTYVLPAFAVCGPDVVPGFSIAPLGMKEGGRRVVVIPPTFGYGPGGQPAAGIAGTDTLVFTIDLVKVGA